jgi:IS5 family transposase
VYVDKKRRAATPKRLGKPMKRRPAVEPTIGHLKSEHRLGRNRFKGLAGNALNAILSAAAMNFAKLMATVLRFSVRLLVVLKSLIGRSVRPAGA